MHLFKDWRNLILLKALCVCWCGGAQHVCWRRRRSTDAELFSIQSRTWATVGSETAWRLNCNNWCCRELCPGDPTWCWALFDVSGSSMPNQPYRLWVTQLGRRANQASSIPGTLQRKGWHYNVWKKNAWSHQQIFNEVITVALIMVFYTQKISTVNELR